MKGKGLLAAVPALIFIFGLVLVAIGGETEEGGSAECDTKAIKGPGEFKADYQTSSHFFTLMSGMKKGRSPHGEVQIYYSVNIRDKIKMPAFTAPEGTVSVKPFNNDGKPGVDGIAVMVKKEKGYDPDNNDWHYEMRTPDGELMEKDGVPMAGKIGMCIGCHAVASARDYLAGTEMQ